MMTPDDLHDNVNKLVDFLQTLGDGKLTIIEAATVIGVVTSTLLRLMPKSTADDFVGTLTRLLPSTSVDTLQ